MIHLQHRVAASRRDAAIQFGDGSGMRRRLKGWAKVIKRDVHALYLAARDPRVP
jgi:hypothetical protein